MSEQRQTDRETGPAQSSISVFFLAYNDGGTIPSMVLTALMTLRALSDDCPDSGPVGDSLDSLDHFRGKKVLITGGLGFIGSNLAHRLVKLGAEVLIVDSLIPEYGGNFFNVAGIEDRVRIDIGDYYGDFCWIRSKLGWCPRVPLEDGLRRTLRFYEEHGSHYWEEE